MKSALHITLAVLLLWGSLALATEEPAYTIMGSLADDIELRQYDAFVVAETALPAHMQRSKAASEAFYILFKYIQGANTSSAAIEMTAPVLQGKGTEIAMTAPVIQQQSVDHWRVSFVLPSQYSKISEAPVPTDSRVRLVQLPPRQVAAIRYSGRWSEKNYEKFRVKLEAALNEKGIATRGDYLSAAYNAPFVPPFMRRNEVMVEIPVTSSFQESAL